MKIAGIYSFNNGETVVKQKYADLRKEVERAILKIDATACKTKESKKKTTPGDMLYSPVSLNEVFKAQLEPLDWKSVRVKCEYPTEFYVKGYEPKKLRKGAFREMDFVKRKLGVEVWSEESSLPVTSVAAKMTIFHNLGFIDTGIEVVPVKKMADEMSSGVSYFEQFVWDLEKRGKADVDIPVLIFGIDAD